MFVDVNKKEKVFIANFLQSFFSLALNWSNHILFLVLDRYNYVFS